MIFGIRSKVPVPRFLVCFFLLLSLLLFTSCASTRNRESPAVELSSRIQALDASVDSYEAFLVSQTACDESAALAQAYHVVRPAILHNMLINCGLKERGLCYHWTDDLLAKLNTLNLQTIALHRAVARPRTLREHNALVVTAVGQPFGEGLVLDAWRDCGRLRWSGVKQDRYPWQPPAQ